MRGASVVLVAALVAAVAGETARDGVAARAGSGITITFLRARAPVVGAVTVMPVRVSNSWPERAVRVTLTVQAPAWVRLAGDGCVLRRPGILCALHDLRPGGAVTVRLRVTPQRLGAFRLVAHAAAMTAVSSPGAVAGESRAPALLSTSGR